VLLCGELCIVRSQEQRCVAVSLRANRREVHHVTGNISGSLDNVVNRWQDLSYRGTPGGSNYQIKASYCDVLSDPNTIQHCEIVR